jgi:hypothetical protein
MAKSAFGHIIRTHQLQIHTFEPVLQNGGGEHTTKGRVRVVGRPFAYTLIMILCPILFFKWIAVSEISFTK